MTTMRRRIARTRLGAIGGEYMHQDSTAKALPDEVEGQRLRLIGLSRWESEGGACPGASPAAAAVIGSAFVDAQTTIDTEAMQLRIRVIALENLVIAILALAPVAQRVLAREMAAYISPRPGYTPHPLTLRAADEMRSLVDRAMNFRASDAD